LRSMYAAAKLAPDFAALNPGYKDEGKGKHR